VPDNYPTLTAAIGNATNGDTILVRSGTYDAPINSTLVIDKSLSIIGEKAQNTIINLYSSYNFTMNYLTPTCIYTDVITITANSCSLQDLTLQETIEGIYQSYGGDVTAEGNNILIADCTINATAVNIQGSNCRVTNNVIGGNNVNYGDVVVTGNYNQIDNNSGYFVDVGVSGVKSGGSYNFVKNNNWQGLTLANCSNNVFFGNNIVVNSASPEIDISWSTNNLIYENTINGPSFGYNVNFYHSSKNTLEANDINLGNKYTGYLVFGASNDNLFTLNNIYGNISGIHQYYVIDQSTNPDTGPGITVVSTSMWSQNSLGNYWGDYQTKYPNATEVDSTGVGSIPYVINGNNADSYPLMSRYDIATASIQLPDWTNLSVPNMIQTPVFPSPTTTSTPTSSPTVPEISWLMIVPLLLSLLLVAVVLRQRKTNVKLS
jgi:hypothetical protein